MKILVVNHFPVSPPVRGGRLLVYNLALALSRHAERVVILCLSTFRDKPNEVRISSNVTELDIPAKPLESVMLAPLYALGLNNVDAFSSLKTPDSFMEYCGDYDVCLLEHPYLSPLLDKRSKIAYDAIDVEWIGTREYNKGNPLGTIVNRKVFAVERLACEVSDVVFATNDADRMALEQIYSPRGRTFTLRPAMDTKSKRPVKRGGNLVTFIGSDVIHNRRILSVLLEVASKLPNREFYIGGSIADKVKKPPKNIELGSSYPHENGEIEKVYSKTAVALSIESRHGTGTPMKTLEYMAYGLPVLVLGSEASRIGYTHEKNVYVTSLKSLRDDVESLLRSEGKLESIGSGGRAFVETNNEMGAIGERAFAALSGRV